MAGTTGSACSTPGVFTYASSNYSYCNGTNWISMKGSTMTSCTAANAGFLQYDGTNNVFKFCDGTNWYSTSFVANQILITSSALSTTSYSCSPVTFTSKDSAGQVVPLSQPVNISPNGNGILFFWDSSCSDSETTFAMSAGQTSLTLYAQFTVAGSIPLQAVYSNGYTKQTQTETITAAPGLWTGAVSNDFNTSGNWAGGAVPTSSVDVIFGLICPNCNVFINANASVKSIRAYSPAGLDTSSGVSLSVTNDMNLTPSVGGGGTNQFSGPLTVGGNLYAQFGGTFDMLSGCTANLKNVVVSGTNFTSEVGSTVNISGSYDGVGATFNGPVNFTGTGHLASTSGNETFAGGVTFATGSNVSFTQGSVLPTGAPTALTIASSGTLTLTSTTSYINTSNGSISIAGHLTCPRGVSNFGISLTGTSTFTEATTGVITDCGVDITANTTAATAITFGNSNTYDHLTIATSGHSAKAVFQAGSTQTIDVGGALNFTGASGKVLTLNSSTSGTPWKIAPAQNTTLGGYLTVKDSNNTGGVTLHSGPNFTNVSGNTNWSFP